MRAIHHDSKNSNSNNTKSRVAENASSSRRKNANDASNTVSSINKSNKRRGVNPLSPPTTLEVCGVRVHFPFRPYKCQEQYMETVMNALLKSENALLESPTGTGKTLCLLCACLAWQRHQASTTQQKQQSLLPDASSTQENNHIAPNSNNNINNNNTNNTRRPVVVYASRTHSQLSQVVRELRNTRYRPIHAVLGSREQMCIHPKVVVGNNNNSKKNAKQGDTANNNSSTGGGARTMNASEINHHCNKLGKDRLCRFRNNLDGFVAPSSCESTTSQQRLQPVLDMEELVTMGKAHSVCPFYYTRAQVEQAELVLVPYNYLFDKDARELTLSNNIAWNNAIVIFDEAHNLESFASESASFDLSNTDVAGCVAEVTKAMNYIQSMPPDTGTTTANLKLDNLIRLKTIFLSLEHYMCNLGPQHAYNGEFMMEIFQQGCGINHSNHEIFIDQVRKVNDLIMDLRGATARGAAPKLEHFVSCVKRVFAYALESRCLAKAACYRVHISPKTTATAASLTTITTNRGFAAQPQPAGRTISYWCFAPSLAMEELANLNVRSILVTSGTLSPLPSYSMELGLPFPHQLENPHIISPRQIHVRVIGKGVSGKLLNSSYERRKEKDYATELGNTLVSIAKVTPAGMLIFFPSYSVMESCMEEWGGPASTRSNFAGSGATKPHAFFAQRKKPANNGGGSTPFAFPFAPAHFASDPAARSTPWKRLLATKSIVVEPKSAADLSNALGEFKKFLAMPKSPGCILMGVCRGKISEGIDFADEQSRAVIITGLPFPPSFDAKVKMKREFLDNSRANRAIKASGDGGFGPQSSSTQNNKSDRLSGHEWYIQQAHRAVNQAIGRVIRNQKDYGAVLLLDSRFDQAQNHAGLSKWLRPHLQNDEGFGTAVRGLVDFYKTAEQFTKTREVEDQRELQRSRPILEYDDDLLGNAPEPPSSKVAVVRRANEDTTKSADGAAAYVAPEDVVARIDVNDLLEAKVNDTSLLSIPESLPKSNDVIFGCKPVEPIDNRSKALAVQFMDRIKENLSNTDQSTIRKAIVAMKASGDKGDHESYLKSASAIIKLVHSCEPFDSVISNDSTRMLFLFFGLLPVEFRKKVEILSFKLAFDGSSLGRLVKRNWGSEFDAILSAIGPLLRTLWCRSTDVPMPVEIYLRESQTILQRLPLTDSSSLGKDMLAAFLKLIPEAFRIPTRTWIAEKNASYNIRKIKEADKIKVRESQNVYLTGGGKRDGAITSNSANTSIAKRKLDEPFAAPRSKPAINPYASKKSSVGRSIPTSGQIEQRLLHVQNQQPCSDTAYVQKFRSDSFANNTKSNPAQKIVQKLKSNASSDMTCPICSDLCKEPFVADCGHVACLSCWLDWLHRSQTCMTCRVRTTKDSLARVLYETTPGSGAPPTLSQLCANRNNDSDDELEIG